MKTCIRWLNKEIRRIDALVELFEGYARQARGTQISARTMEDIEKWKTVATSYEARKRCRETELETLRRIRDRLLEVLHGVS